jgi:hypothetical protein
MISNQFFTRTLLTFVFGSTLLCDSLAVDEKQANAAVAQFWKDYESMVAKVKAGAESVEPRLSSDAVIVLDFPDVNSFAKRVFRKDAFLKEIASSWKFAKRLDATSKVVSFKYDVEAGRGMSTAQITVLAYNANMPPQAAPGSAIKWEGNVTIEFYFKDDMLVVMYLHESPSF